MLCLSFTAPPEQTSCVTPSPLSPTSPQRPPVDSLFSPQRHDRPQQDSEVEQSEADLSLRWAPVPAQIGGHPAKLHERLLVTRRRLTGLVRGARVWDADRPEPDDSGAMREI